MKDLRVGTEENLDFCIPALETFKAFNPALNTASARDQLDRKYQNTQSKCNEDLDHVWYAFIDFAPLLTNEHSAMCSGILVFGYSHQKGLNLPGSRLQTVFRRVRNGSSQSSA